ncbi:neurogenic locus notch homolog protein 1 [Plakobranchus ocellatus]|uniref:Neurogenic locus notch homolog protein 1 n=1 Tax=Plakobranchus ocellatus TaxID=259542 RepID=A0AAV4DNN2_9GAST|nr:neurogenic locus notch homolog protein 1 [Plakobranchus ocellatus]
MLIIGYPHTNPHMNTTVSPIIGYPHKNSHMRTTLSLITGYPHRNPHMITTLSLIIGFFVVNRLPLKSAETFQYRFDNDPRRTSIAGSNSKFPNMKTENRYMLNGYRITYSQSEPCGPLLVCRNGGQCVTSGANSRCQCAPGYTGSQCETDINWCVTPGPHDCRNNAQCVDELLGYSCVCLSGWEGEFCEKEKNECLSNPCENGGQCTDEFDAFSCNCTSQFSGPTCTTDVDECALNNTICANNGTCQNIIGGFDCVCVPGYTGALCETEINECDSNPCLYDGKCIDLINNFRCECQPSFVGPRCQGIVNRCVVDNPCQAGAACVDTPGGGYACFCPPGYYGPHCESEENVCGSKPCRNGATCIQLTEGYSCRCATGFTGSNCESDINECSPSPCQHNGTCNETTPGSYICNCVPGYRGDKCEININDCETNLCQGQQICIDLINDYRCICPEGKTGALCDTDLVDCTVTPCENGGTCTTSDTSNLPTAIENTNANIPHCECVDPFIGQTCNQSADVCVPEPCQHGGTCVRSSDGNGTLSATCTCAQGYIGDQCQTLVEDCRGAQTCRNGGQCVGKVEVPGSAPKFECACPENYTGTLCEREPSGCIPDPCSNNSTCIALEPLDYRCECLSGWTGQLCENDLDECLATPDSPVCKNQGVCVNMEPGYRCVCSRFWTGPTCEADVLECAADNATLTCHNNGTCLEVTGGPPKCLCAEGYTGDDCFFKVGSCEPNPCRNNATCTSNTNYTINNSNITNDNTTNEDVTCTCVPGFTGRLCEANIDECTLLQPCLNNGICVDEVNSYTCQCPAGWEGTRCETEVDDCESMPCRNGGTCEDLTQGFLCRCPQGYAGRTCEREVNECSFNPCRNNATCIDLVNAFRCQCQPGFTGVACSIDINECDSNPCSSQATCVEGVNTYECVCPLGFEGSDCSTDIDECESKPCLHGGTCIQGEPPTFNCSCPPGVTGQLCEAVATATFDGSSALTFRTIPQQDSSSTSVLGSTSTINLKRKKRAIESISPQRHQVVGYQSHSVSQTLHISRWRRQAVRPTHDNMDSVANENQVLFTQIQFTFTTTVLEGILLVVTGVSNAGKPQHVVLEMVSGDLHLSASDGSRLLNSQVSVSGQSNSGVASHVVLLSVSREGIELRLNPNACDDNEGNGDSSAENIKCQTAKLNFSAADEGSSESEWNLNGQYHFGGVSRFTSYTRSIVQDTKGFVGCLGNLMVDGRPINLADATEFTSAQNATLGTAPESGCGSHSPCLQTSCANGGTCQDLWLAQVCACAPGFTGNKCGFQNMVNFEPGSMLHFAGNPVISQISFIMSAANHTGLLLYTLTTDSLSISLDNGQIRLQLISYDTGRDLVSRVGGDLHLERWVKVTVQFTNNQYSLDVSSEDGGSLGSVTGTAGSVILVTGPLFLGALHSHPAMDKWRDRQLALPSPLSFKGCIRDVTINSQSLDLSTTVPTSLGNDPPKARAGCQKEEECLASPCANGGTCIPEWAGPTCKCAEGYEGDNCTDASAFTFDGESSYSFIALDRSLFPFGDSGHLEFRTRQSTATLMLMQFQTRNGTVGDFIEIRTFSGQLQIYSSFTAETEPSNGQVSDGQWHILQWTRSGTRLDIQLDDFSLLLESGFDPHSATFGDLVHVYLSARPFLPGDATQMVAFFKGCMRGVSFNSQKIDFASATHNVTTGNRQTATSDSGLDVTPVSISAGCNGDRVCHVNPCPDNSFCVDEWNLATCPCLLGWEGDQCNSSVDDCTTNLCQNEALCEDGHLSYTCICPSDRFTGRYCESLTNPCQDDSPCNATTTASCVALNDTSVQCVCRPGYTGFTCHDIIDNCSPSPCRNRGVCFNKPNSFTCDCPKGYSGLVCDEVDPCLSEPCNNGGICLPTTQQLNSSVNTNSSRAEMAPDIIRSNPSETISPSSSSSNSDAAVHEDSSPSNSVLNTTVDLAFTCACQKPYYGSQCQNYDFCAGNLCRNNASCVLGQNRYTCSCTDLFYGTLCEFENHCASLPCHHGAECRNEADTYVCLCPFYFTGKNCETAINQCAFNLCFNGGTCVFNESAISAAYASSSQSQSLSSSSSPLTSSSPSLSSQINISSSSLQFLSQSDPNRSSSTALVSKHPSNSTDLSIDSTYCICSSGFKGDNCEVDVNECDSNPCRNNATCRDSTTRHPGESFFVGFRCSCLPGFSGDSCEKEANECKNFSSNDNQTTSACLNGGICEDLVNDFRCSCPAGFNGSRCENDVRGCASAPCQNGARCHGDEDDPTVYGCICEPGFTGSQCEVNIPDCIDHQCENGATCQDGTNSYTCLCLPGYSGQYCEVVVDACYSQPCFNGGQCFFQGLCSCEDVIAGCGWQDDACQQSSCAQRPDCQAFTVPYVCNCTGTGYIAPQCAQDEDECDTSPCLHGGLCTNSVGSYSCSCLGTGYHGRSCEMDDDECQSSEACFNGGTCVNIPGSYRCECPSEWDGPRCGQNKDDCALENPCMNGGRCQDQMGGYQCDCDNTGYEGENCTENVDDCTNHRCEHNGTCVDGVRQYSCQCEGTGYTGQFCHLEPATCTTSTCLNGGRCYVNPAGAAFCICEDTGFQGNVCQTDVNECREGTHNCQGDSLCLNNIGNYSCDCGTTRTGVFCETVLPGRQTGESSSTSSLSDAGIAGVVVAFVVVIVLILAILGYLVLRRRRTHGRYKPSEAESMANGGAGLGRRGQGMVAVNGTAGALEMVDTSGERMI